jgi:hypothetical protein
MRRRIFFGTCGVYLAGSLNGQTRGEVDESFRLLCALASVVVPDKDPMAWEKGPARDKLLEAWRGTGEKERKRISSFLDFLNNEARKAAGGIDFGSLDIHARTSLLGAILDKSPDLAGDFSRIRHLIVLSFYSSSIGYLRTGYIPTTQFKGYREFFQKPEGRE